MIVVLLLCVIGRLCSVIIALLLGVFGSLLRSVDNVSLYKCV